MNALEQKQYWGKVTETVSEIFKRKLEEMDKNIDALDAKCVGEDSLEVIREANSWLKTFAEMNNQPELYEAYRYHVYIVENTLTVIQGIEQDTSPRKEEA
jgi:hypothetical protein